MNYGVIAEVIQYVVLPVAAVIGPFLWQLYNRGKELDKELAILKETKAEREDVQDLKVIMAELRTTIGHNSDVLREIKEKL